MHFGASAGRADARRRDAGDVVTSSRSGNAADARPPPRPSGLRPAGPLAALLAPYIPQRVCSSLAPCQRAWGPAAKCTPYFLTGPKGRGTLRGDRSSREDIKAPSTSTKPREARTSGIFSRYEGTAGPSGTRSPVTGSNKCSACWSKEIQTLVSISIRAVASVRAAIFSLPTFRNRKVSFPKASET